MPLLRQIEQHVELGAGEGVVLAGALHLHEAGRLEHDDVGIHVRVPVLEVRQVEPLLALDHSHRHRGHQPAERRRHAGALGQPGAGVGQGDAAAGDARPSGCPPSAWSTSQSMRMVCSPNAMVAMAARSERPMSRWISWVRPPGPFRSREVRSTVARGSMAYSAVTQPSPLPFLKPGTPASTDGGAVHQRAAHADQAGAFGVRVGAPLEHERAKLIVGAAIRTRHGDAPRGLVVEKPGDERHADHAAAPGLDPVGADDTVAGVVGAFHQDIGRERPDQLERRVLVEEHDAVHRARDRRAPGRAHPARPTGRAGPLPRRRTDASVLTPTTRASPSRRAASSSSTWPGCSRSNTPLVKTTGPGCGARQATAPAQVAHLGRADRRSRAGSGRRRTAALSAGGATNVVAMTISSTAPNTSSLSTPARRPMSAKMSPTSPRGTIPTPTTRRRMRTQGAAQPAASLPTIADARSAPPRRPASPGRPATSGRAAAGSTEAPTLTKKIGREDRRHRPDLVLDGVELVGAREDEARPRRPPMMSAEPGQRRPAPARAERERHREDQEDVAHPHPDHEVEQPRHEEAAEQHGDDQEARPRPRSVRSDADARSRPCPAATPVTTLRMTRPSTSSMTAAPMMMRASGVLIRPRSASTRAVMPTEVAVSVAPTKMAAVVEIARAARGVRRVGPVGVAQPERQHDAHDRDGERRGPDPEHLAEVGLEPDLEQQQQHAELGQDVDQLAGRRRRAGTIPSTLPPSSTPATSSPSTAGCPIRSASSPSSLAATRMAARARKNPAMSTLQAAPRRADGAGRSA